MISRAHFILYVADQPTATAFWSSVLRSGPTLEEPGMTEFEVGESAVLGLMPRANIARLLGLDALDDAVAGQPQAEVYLVVDDPAGHHRRALAAGAKELAPLASRPWGHDVAYSITSDSHVLAFAGATGRTADVAGDRISGSPR